VNSIFEEFLKQNCCGCGACSVICPQKAITMLYDSHGFLYPYLDKNKCVNCGLCNNVCAFKEYKSIQNDFVLSYAVRAKDNYELMTSRSGGFFSVLSRYILKLGGVVFGCVEESPKVIKHCKIEKEDDIYLLKNSKYVQSNIENCFSECLEQLQKDKYVLFSGTPCQTHSMIYFLKFKHINTAKLITVDIVCHGVPSPVLWGDYITYIESKYHKSVKKVNFRNKEDFGWKSHIETYYFTDNTSISFNKWASAFYEHNMFRESCYNCKYTTINRISDITIADYWGIEKITNSFNDDKGVNLVILHNEKAKQLFENISDDIVLEKTQIEQSLQPNLVRPSKKGDKYSKFWNDYANLSSTKFFKKYFFNSYFAKIIRKIKHIVNKKSD